MPPPEGVRFDEEFEDILANAYGDGSGEDYDALDDVLAAWNWRLGVDFGGREVEMRQLVRKILARADQEGSAFRRETVQVFYKALPWDRRLRAWVAKNLPDAVDHVPERDFLAAEKRKQQERVDAVAEALAGIRGTTREALLAGEIGSRARSDLKAVAYNLMRLSAYKSVHDTLHGIQTGSYAELAPLIAFGGELTSEAADKIEGEVYKLDSARVRIDMILTLLSSTDDWLKDLDEAIDKLRSQPPTASNVRAGLLALRMVLRQQLPQYDTVMVGAAKGIPFGAAVAFLHRAAVQAGTSLETQAMLAKAAEDLAALDNSLSRTLRLHESWQSVDANLWQIEQALQPFFARDPASDGADPGATQSREAQLDLVRFIWKSITRSLENLRQSAPDSWSPGIDGAIESAGRSLAETGAPAATIVAGLNPFLRAARLQFLKIDKTVLALCTQIAKLREPIEQFLGGD